MKFNVRNRYTGAVQFTAEIECAKDAYCSAKLGLAVKWAVKTGANLADADLADADLAGAYLAGANLARTNLAGAYLAGAYLARTNLAHADLAGANLARTNLAHADLAGANLAHANLESANLARTNLAHADLAGANLARTNLAHADLAGANLAHANLESAYLVGAYLAGAYLAGANLARTNLADADLADADLAGAYLAGAKNIDAKDALKIPPEDIPSVPNIDAAILAAIETGGTLDMGSWHGDNDHWCGTTHCRAGWAIHLAGQKGRDLELKVGPRTAGAMIYRASRPGIPAPNFFALTDAAMADIRKCAAEQTKSS